MNPERRALRTEFDRLSDAREGRSTNYRIATSNQNVYEIERIFRALKVQFTLVYGDGMEDPEPERSVTFYFSGVDRAVAESVAKLIQHINHTAVLIPGKRPPGIVRLK